MEGSARAVSTLQDTHGLVTRPGTRIGATSEVLGWRLVFASTQREAPFEDMFGPVADHFVVIHLSGPVRVTRTLDGKQEARRIPPGDRRHRARLRILPSGTLDPGLPKVLRNHPGGLPVVRKDPIERFCVGFVPYLVPFRAGHRGAASIA